MLQFTIPTLKCKGCVRGLTAAVQALDPDARIEVDLVSKAVHIETRTEAAAVVKALAEAGFAPTASGP